MLIWYPDMLSNEKCNSKLTELSNHDKTRNEKLKYDINREAEKISALSSGKNDKYEYLTGKEILPSNWRQITEQDKFTYSLLGKAFQK